MPSPGLTPQRQLRDLLTGGDQLPERDGYLDTLPGDAERQPGIAQRAMHAGLLPAIYERVWRPVLFRAFTGRSTGAETRLMLKRVGPRPGERMLDIACGPGNTTRRLAEHAGDQGLVVGLDFAASMLRRAVADTPQANVAYARGDALALPFADGTFDVVTCFGALYMLPDPALALQEMARVLAPGGRVCVLTASTGVSGALSEIPRQVGKLSGFNLQQPQFVAGVLREAGLERVTVDARAFGQLVSARRAG